MSSNRNSTLNTESGSLLVYVTGDRIGDALLKYPVMRAYRAACPQVRVSWVTGMRPSIFATRLAPLAAGLIDEIHSSSGLGQRWFGALPAILANRYDTIVSTEARLRDTLALRRIECSTFISPAWGFLFSSCKPAIDFNAASAYERFNALMSLAAGVTLAPQAQIEVPGELTALAAELLPDGAHYIGFCPGAGGASKRWPVERFIELARRQAARGRAPLFLLGPAEQSLRGTIAEAVPGVRFIEEEAAMRGASGPLATIALAQRLTLAISNDSGGGHLLAAGGRPTIKLYGHTNPHKFRSPYGEQIAIEASAFGSKAMIAISIDHVEQVIERQLTRTSM